MTRVRARVARESKNGDADCKEEKIRGSSVGGWCIQPAPGTESYNVIAMGKIGAEPRRSKCRFRNLKCARY